MDLVEQFHREIQKPPTAPLREVRTFLMRHNPAFDLDQLYRTNFEESVSLQNLRPGETESFHPRTTTLAEKGMEDLVPYFAQDTARPRQYFRWFSRHHYDEKTYQDYPDLFVLKETQSDGKDIVAVFQYDANAEYRNVVFEDGTTCRIPFRRLLASYRISKQGETPQAEILFEDDQNLSLGFIDQSITLSPVDQLQHLAQYSPGVFLFTDTPTFNWEDIAKAGETYERVKRQPDELSQMFDALKTNPAFAVQASEALTHLGIAIEPSTIEDLLEDIFRAREIQEVAQQLIGSGISVPTTTKEGEALITTYGALAEQAAAFYGRINAAAQTPVISISQVLEQLLSLRQRHHAPRRSPPRPS